MANGKKGKILLILIPVVLIFIISMFLSLKGNIDINISESALIVSILKVGKADAIILRSGDHTMVIDTGEDDDGDEVAEFLSDRGIDNVEVLLITHFDKDHVGGADILVKKTAVQRILIPDYENDNKEYKEFMDTLHDRSLTPERVNEDMEFAFGDCSVCVEPPESFEINGKEEDPDNDLSLITTVKCGDTSFLFMADAEEKRIAEYLDRHRGEQHQFIKLPHHGRYKDNLGDLLDSVKPLCSVSCTSDKNPMEKETAALLKDRGIVSLETRDGDITVESNGKEISWHSQN
ncbi:MAG: MBL fold metallo-hydrolase [Lachnospiraceae bacterium]|nr:MBL fold metallo-hydrolase [Lachnospiraceae bacterium]